MEVKPPIPKALRGKGLRALFDSGLAGLLSRLWWQDRFGDQLSDSLSPGEIAKLVEAFADDPLPVELRRLVVRQLQGRVKRRPGRRARRPTTREM
jgi:hypothetical protein